MYKVGRVLPMVIWSEFRLGSIETTTIRRMHSTLSGYFGTLPTKATRISNIILDNIRNYTRIVYERKLQNVSDKFPNAKIIFMVKDPRAFIATRLRRARSKIHRRRQYFELMELWLKLNKQLIKECFKVFS